jgi:hypothetical protein
VRMSPVWPAAFRAKCPAQWSGLNTFTLIEIGHMSCSWNDLLVEVFKSLGKKFEFRTSAKPESSADYLAVGRPCAATSFGWWTLCLQCACASSSLKSVTISQLQICQLLFLMFKVQVHLPKSENQVVGSAGECRQPCPEKYEGSHGLLGRGTVVVFFV